MTKLYVIEGGRRDRGQERGSGMRQGVRTVLTLIRSRLSKIKRQDEVALLSSLRVVKGSASNFDLREAKEWVDLNYLQQRGLKLADCFELLDHLFEKRGEFVHADHVLGSLRYRIFCRGVHWPIDEEAWQLLGALPGIDETCLDEVNFEKVLHCRAPDGAFLKLFFGSPLDPLSGWRVGVERD